jgi:hypothetical protein
MQLISKLKFSFLLRVLAIFFNFGSVIIAQELPEILKVKSIDNSNYLTDFSFAGYHYGEKEIPISATKIIFVTDFGLIASDSLDDSKNLIKAIVASKTIKGTVLLQLPAGRIILSEILYIERSNFVLSVAGTGEMGTEIYFPRPLMYVIDPKSLQELREYLIQFDKRQRKKENNIDLSFSQYAWSDGFIWTRNPGVRVNSYLQKYKKPYNVLANVLEGKKGAFTLKVKNVKGLKKGDVVVLQLFNKDGETGKIIKEMYKGVDMEIGPHQWNFLDLPLVNQQVKVTSVKNNIVTIKSPLTIDIKPIYKAQITEWEHLEEVGIEHLKLTFPESPRVAYHTELGNNGIFLTRIFNSWLKDVVIENAYSGILTEEIANVTIKNITIQGTNFAHYTVAMAGVHNVLVENIKVYNEAEHPLSFNTFSTKNVYLNCEVFVKPVLDQHSGANQQNLFDNITVHLTPNEDRSYPIFARGGSGYWKYPHASYSAFWNINVNLLSGLENIAPVLLNGMKDGPFARLIGVHGNHTFKIEYGPSPYIEMTNTKLKDIPSL